MSVQDLIDSYNAQKPKWEAYIGKALATELLAIMQQCVTDGTPDHEMWTQLETYYNEWKVATKQLETINAELARLEGM